MQQESRILVSLHVPKTAGTSLQRVLETRFGERLLLDYGDYPINARRLKRNWHALAQCVATYFFNRVGQVECIHGHFLPLKYLFLSRWARVEFVMWLRDPVERAASHYYYWLRSYDPERSLPLHARMVREGWSLERFCLGPELRNLYSQLLWGFPLARFSFVGVVEDYDRSYQEFCARFLGGIIPPRRLNENPQGVRNIYIRDPVLRKAVEEFHAADMKIYRWALALRGIRL